MSVLAALLTYLLAAGLLALAFPVAAITWLATAPFDPARLATSRSIRFLGEAIIRLAPLWSVTIEGALPPAPAAFVVVPNHQSLVDALAVARLPREMKWIGKASVFRIPWLGWAFRLAGHVPVLRGDRPSGSAALARLRRYLDAGIPVGLFAEGSRSRDGALLPFRAGPFKLAIDAGVPVVPVAIAGAGDAMAPDGFAIRPSRMRVRILPPLATAGLGPGDVERLREETRARIAAALAELERPSA